MRRATLFLAGLLVLLLAVPADAVTITIVNKDIAGQGLNDPTPAPPVGGNPGTTIGEQRMNVFKQAAAIWGLNLPGSVEIKVDASFQPLFCNTNSAVLGGTGPTFVESDFGGGAVPGVWYIVAQASQMAGSDLEPGSSYMTATFNSNLGQTGCLTGNFFYYGFDTNTPANSINLLTTSLHEFAHGLGFISLANESTGAFCCGAQPRPDIFDAFVYDTTAAKSWNDMATDGERVASAINSGNLVWNGPIANTAGAAYLATGVPVLTVSSPAAAAGSYFVGAAAFGPPLSASGVTGTLVAANPSDPGGPTSTDGCSALSNPAAVAGKVALINRGSCNFPVKVKNAQNAGSIGVVIADYDPSTPPAGMFGTDPTVTIPSVRVSQIDGATLRANLPVEVKMGLDIAQHAGMNSNGQMLLYGPNPVQPGSSVSHWDTSATPNLLMEPIINNDLPIGVDITTDLFRDIGWFPTSLPTAMKFFTVTPCRQLDTRSSFPIASHTALTVTLTGSPCGIPAGARSVSVNVAETQPLGVGGGHLRIYPADGTLPGISSLNFNTGQTRSNNAVLKLSGDGTGRVKIYNASGGTVHVIVDVNSYFQ